jgi:hypothetical protein
LQAPKENIRGVLIAEAVVASFLMLFAFIAASQLFDASLRWESNSANDRLAAIIAERRMEELRGWVDKECQSAGFHSLNWGSKAVTDDSFPDAPGFLITVKFALPTYQVAKPNSDRDDAPDGLHSPCSALYMAPPGSGNAQKSAEWQTYPWTRDMSDSVKLVHITVRYGSGGARDYELVSLLADPVSPPAANNATFTTSPVRVLGPGSISSSGPENFTAELRLPSNQKVEDVTFVWSTGPEQSGAVIIRPTTPDAAEVSVERSPIAIPGTRIDLTAKVFYRGREIIGRKVVNL